MPTPSLTFEQFKKQFTDYMRDGGFYKFNAKNKIAALKDQHQMLIPIYEEHIQGINERILINEVMKIDVEQYEDDVDLLKPRIINEISRLEKYRDELTTQLSLAKTLVFLTSLDSKALLEEAKSNQESAVLIANTTELIEQIPSSEFEHVTHHDPSITKLLALALTSREYTTDTPKIVTALTKEVSDKQDLEFMANQEKVAIRQLLLKMKSHLEETIDRAIREKRSPWQLGYFGSRHKWQRDPHHQVSVPQGIFEVKKHLDQLDNLQPNEILERIQGTINSKLAVTQDESYLQQFKRFLSYIFGYHRTQETIEEYTYLSEVASGRRL